MTKQKKAKSADLAFLFSCITKILKLWLKIQKDKFISASIHRGTQLPTTYCNILFHNINALRNSVNFYYLFILILVCRSPFIKVSSKRLPFGFL